MFANAKARVILEQNYESFYMTHFFRKADDNPCEDFYMEHISRQKCVACTNVTGPTHEYDIDGYKKRQCHPYALGWFQN